jgi:hypothetical protein
LVWKRKLLHVSHDHCHVEAVSSSTLTRPLRRSERDIGCDHVRARTSKGFGIHSGPRTHNQCTAAGEFIADRTNASLEFLTQEPGVEERRTVWSLDLPLRIRVVEEDSLSSFHVI